ncbi:MAG TPA: F0F1 ATP synthase subunit delta [Buchnera sp. (in: enterobacteria)]|nr:F0F1 ATP synthase subunit delta [Buchnera sp. (in: enterobacteria)]
MFNYLSIIRVYAKSIFELAKEEKKIDNWENMLFFSVEISRNFQIKKLFSGVLSSEYTARVFITLCGNQINLQFQNLIKIMAENKRLHLLKNVLSEFIYLKNNYNGIIEAKIISSQALNELQIHHIFFFLKKKFNRKINLKYNIDSSIIDGFIIKINNMVIDMSIRGRLKQLENFLNY